MAPPPALAQTTIPTISYSGSSCTNPSILNTNAAATAFGTADPSWTVSNPLQSGVYVATTPITNIAVAFPTGAPFSTAYVFNGGSGGSIANLATIQNTGGAEEVDGQFYYRIQFTLAPSVDPTSFSLSVNYAADDAVIAAWVNGTRVTPFTQAGDSAVTGAPAPNSTSTLTGPWVTGTNTVIFQTWNIPDTLGPGVPAVGALTSFNRLLRNAPSPSQS